MNIYTKEYKGFLIKPYKEVPSALQIVTAGKGGKIPDCLSGMFTSRARANLEIDLYLARKEDVNEKNPEAGSK